MSSEALERPDKRLQVGSEVLERLDKRLQVGSEVLERADKRLRENSQTHMCWRFAIHFGDRKSGMAEYEHDGLAACCYLRGGSEILAA